MTTHTRRGGQLRRAATPLFLLLVLAAAFAAASGVRSQESGVRNDAPTSDSRLLIPGSPIPHSAFRIPHSSGQWVVVPPVTSNSLRDVHMVRSNLGWAVGEQGIVLRYDGAAWQQVDISTTDTLVDVFMLDANNGWIVGWAGAMGAEIFKYDGSDWRSVYSDEHSLSRIGTSSPNNVWAAGLNHTVHWDGNRWTEVPIPVDRQLFNVQVPSAAEAWSLGQFEPVSERGLILHYVCGAWIQQLSPAPQSIFDSFFTTPNDGWAAGFNQEDSYILHYDGIRWTRAFTNTYQLDRLYMLSATDGWGTSAVSGVIAQYDGSDFVPVTNPAPTAYLSSLYMVSPSDGWIVGNKGTMLHYIDSNPPPTSTPIATPTLCPMSFSDVPPGSTFYSYIRYLYCRNVVSGYANGTFRPDNNATRGQIAKIVVLAQGWTINRNCSPHFSDVPPGSTFFDYVETAYNARILAGYADGTFHPDANVTRGQLCKIVVLAEEWIIINPDTATFIDVPRLHTFYRYIETAYFHGLVGGYPDHTFHPDNPATRGQISKIVYLAVTAQ